jgi:ATP-dependent Lon protease
MEADLNEKLNAVFDGKVVRKDLTNLIKESASVPVFVLEYLLGMYCASNDEEVIEEGLALVKEILRDNYVRPDEAHKIQSKVKEHGTFKVIDKMTVRLDDKKDCYIGEFSNLGLKNVLIQSKYVRNYEKLLAGGIWCIVQLDYIFEEGAKVSPFTIEDIKPIQIPGTDLEVYLEGRKHFTKEEWLDVLIRTTGMEPTVLEPRTKMHLLARLIPFVENNYNMIELGPRSTGKSHVYKELSPNSILISGGQTTVANLFYNMSSKQIGLVGLWDIVAFDEVAGIKFKDQDGIQIMKDYMNSGSFARGKEQKEGKASLVFVGNINQSVDNLLKTSHLLSPFPDAMIDSAFFDRVHAYIPGWEIPKYKPDFFTSEYGFIVDYLADTCRELRKRSFGDAIDKYFRLGNCLNQRDTKAVRKTVSGLLKLLFPNEDYKKEDVKECLIYAMEVRRRVKEALKKIGGMEFYDVHFSFIDLDTSEEHFVSVLEQGGNSLIPSGSLRPGTLHTVVQGTGEQIGIYRVELQLMEGTGKFQNSGLGSVSKAKEALKVAFDFFKANVKSVTNYEIGNRDYHLHLVDLLGVGVPEKLTLPTLISLCTGILNKPVIESVVILGDMSLGGSLIKVENLAETLQVAFDGGAKKILLPMVNATDIATVPPELFTKFQTSFYSDPVDAVFKAVGID